MAKQGLNRRGIGDRVFDAVNAIVLLALVFVTLYPMYYVLCASVSNNVELMATPELQAALGGISAVPTLVFVDAKGTVRGVESGIHSASRLRARIAELAAPTN